MPLTGKDKLQAHMLHRHTAGAYAALSLHASCSPPARHTPQTATQLTICCRLENGLNKLHKTQSEVDVLVENARAMALDVEQKVASANVFAEQVRFNSGRAPVCQLCRSVEGQYCGAV